MPEFDVRNYIAPGPVANAFIEDYEHSVKGIMGPQGSGKTNACIAAAQKHMFRMPPCHDGVTRWKGAVVRDTYQQLYSTTIKSWWEWFPQDIGKWVGSDGRPATHTVPFKDITTGRKYEMIMEFKALQDHLIENVFKGWEGSWFWINEADLLPEAALTFMYGRIVQARYPAPQDVDGSWDPQGVLDYNAPDPENYLYRLREEECPPDWKFYKQPGGLEPDAENLTRRLPSGRIIKAMERSAYEKLKRNSPKWWTIRFVDGKYGYSREGKPVFEDEYDDDVHCANGELEIIDAPIRLGFDAALHPAVTFSQIDPLTGQYRVVEEFVPGWMGAAAFGEHVAERLLADYKSLPIVSARCDPSAFGEDASTRVFPETVSKLIGVRLQPAPSNGLDYRLAAIRKMLGMRSARQPRMIISTKCKSLRKGFMSHYRLRKITINGKETYDDKPDKNKPYSDIMDALEYDTLSFFGLNGVSIDKEKTHRPGNARHRRQGPPKPPGSFNVHKLFR